MLKVGDRVSRQIALFEKERRYGTVVEIYKSIQGVGFTPHKLYSIKWDDEESNIIQRGYFEEGLRKEE